MASSIVLIGGPDSGKTNYLARLWEALRERGGDVIAPHPPPDIKYVEDALAHLLQGSFAPRSDKNLEEGRRDFVIPVVGRGDSQPIELIVPDVTGELWKSAVETREISSAWMDQLNQSIGALLFVRVLSDQNVTPLDWVTSDRLLKLTSDQAQNVDDVTKIPTQVSLSEMLGFLEHTLKPPKDGERPRVAILVTAWDLLDKTRSAEGPKRFLQTEYPLFAGRIWDTQNLDIHVFGVSVVGGDLSADTKFKKQFLERDISASGYVVTDDSDGINTRDDLTLPLAWLIRG